MRFCAENDVLRVERDRNGELIVMSPAGSGTGQKNSQLIYQLVRWAEQDGRGATFDSNAGFTLPDGSMRSPDAAWIAWPRWNALSEADQNRFAPICPEFIVELRSPSDRLGELQAKMEVWIANGSELAWLIDPSRKVEIYRPGQAPDVLESRSCVEGEGPTVGFTLGLARLWD